MAADLGAFSSTATVISVPSFSAQLLQADGGRQAGGAAADDDDVVFHDLALDALQRLERRQVVDDGFLPGVRRAAFDRFLGHGP